MPASITTKTDVIKDSGLIYENGVMTIRRVYKVYNMPLTNTILTDALKAPNIPFYGQRHPVYTFAIAKKFSVDPLIENGKQANNAVTLVVTYTSGLEGGSGVFYSIDFGSTLNQVQTDTDKDGKEIFVTWSAKKNARGRLIKQRGIVPKYVRQDTITFTHWYVTVDSTLSYPTPVEKLKEKYLGKVNGTEFRGGKKHDWMCTQCDGTTQDYGKSYVITIRLERKPNPDKETGGWDEWAWWRNENGEIPYGVSKKNQDGVKRIDNIYGEVDFGELNTDLSGLRSS